MTDFPRSLIEFQQRFGDEAGEDFLVRGVGARMQPDVHEVPSSAAVNSSLMVENC